MMDIHIEFVYDDGYLFIPHDVSFIPWYLISKKPGCRFVGMVRILNDNSRVGFSTTDGRGINILNLFLNL